MPSWIKLRVPAFGQPANTVLRVDSPGQAAQLLNGGFADAATDPGGAPPAVPTPNPGGDYTTDAELAAALAGLGAGAAAPTTDAARESYVPARLSDASLKAAYAAHGESGQTVAASLPNLMTAVRSYDDSATPPLRIIGLGSSVGVGATLPDPTTQAPVARFGSRLAQTINALGNLHLSTTNGSVNGSAVIDFTLSSAYANAKTTAGGSPTVVLFCYGMNDGFSGQYHQGQRYDFFAPLLKAAVQAVLNDGGDAVIVTTPHPRTNMAASWNSSVTPITYPTSGVAVPAFTTAAAVKTADWLGNGQPVPASYRHLRINQAMRAVAAETGVPLIDAERYWFAAVAQYGEDSLFDTNEYAHPNLLGHQQSYWKAIDDFVKGLAAPTVSAAVPRPTSQVFAVKDSNAAYANTTTLAGDQQLTFPVGAGQTWITEAEVFFTEGGGDLRVGFTLPAGSSGSIAVIGAGNTATNYGADTATVRRVALPDTYGLTVGGNGADSSVRVSAVVRTTAAGNVTMAFCQDTSSASATTVYADSYLRATRV